MCVLQTLTRQQLEAMSKDELIQATLAGQVIETITSQEFNSDGELTDLSVTITDAYSGAVIETMETTKTFHANKSVDKIKVNRRDKDGKKIEKYSIKHSDDGKTKPYRVEEE